MTKVSNIKLKVNYYLLLNSVLILLFGAQCERDDVIYNELNGKTTAVFNPNLQYGSVQDVDGNIYRTVKIGTQIWMAENLRMVRYRNGDSIQKVTDNQTWNNQTTGAYNNYCENIDSVATYGRLYNWYAVNDTRGLAPKGWRIPKNVDWSILIEYLGGDTVAGNKLKEIGDKHWFDNFQSDNSSGFTALPGGFIYRDNGKQYFREAGDFWSITEYNSEAAGFVVLQCIDAYIDRGVNFKVNGYSVRCIKESATP